MSEQPKHKLTGLIVANIEVPAKYYADGDDPVEVERRNLESVPDIAITAILNEGNATYIAGHTPMSVFEAAPDMLAALESAIKRLEYGAARLEAVDGDAYAPSVLRNEAEKARAIIAKAKGGVK